MNVELGTGWNPIRMGAWGIYGMGELFLSFVAQGLIGLPTDKKKIMNLELVMRSPSFSGYFVPNFGIACLMLHKDIRIWLLS